MHLVHTEYDPTGLIVPTATYGEIADMADVAIRAAENLDPDPTDYEAVERFAGVCLS